MGDEENTENVVRFPRNWVGPTDELVPIGPRARARAREAEECGQGAEHGSRPTDDPDGIPAAGDFWGEGAAALHHPIRAPSPDTDPAPDVSASDDRALSDARGPQRRGRTDERHHRRPRRPRAPRVLHGPRPGRTRAVSGACLVLAAMLAVAASLGVFGGGGRQASAATHASGPALVSFATLRSDVQKGIRAIGRQVRHEAQLARARAAARTEGRLAATAAKQIRRRRHAYFVELRKRRAASTEHVVASSGQTHSVTDDEATTIPASSSPVVTSAAAEPPAPTSSSGTSSGGTSSGGGTTSVNKPYGYGGLLGAGHAG